MTFTSPEVRSDGWLEAVEAYIDNGWTDGLPVIPPTPESVQAMLDGAGVDGAEVLGDIPTRSLAVTAEKVAINTVMAGCRPEYAPVVVAAVRALLQPLGNAHSTTATLAGAAHAIVVNGPIRNVLGVECGQACLGPGFRANATIGRAVRLVIRNVFRTVPGVLDRASFSWPLRYSFCFGENEEHSDWTPMHVLEGYAPDDDVVTVMSVMRYLTATEFEPEPDAVLDAIAATARFQGLMVDSFVGDARGMMVIMGPEHQRRLVDDGRSKEDVRQALWERMTRPATGAHDNKVELASPENVLVCCAGGPGIAQSQLIMPHLAAPTHERIVVP